MIGTIFCFEWSISEQKKMFLFLLEVEFFWFYAAGYSHLRYSTRTVILATADHSRAKIANKSSKLSRKLLRDIGRTVCSCA